jgi:DNA-binding IclR family transcriptional regulator
MRCIAIPIRNYTGSIVAGLSVTGPSARMPLEKISKNLSYLFMVSKQLSILMGYIEND